MIVLKFLFSIRDGYSYCSPRMSNNLATLLNTSVLLNKGQRQTLGLLLLAKEGWRHFGIFSVLLRVSASSYQTSVFGDTKIHVPCCYLEQEEYEVVQGKCCTLERLVLVRFDAAEPCFFKGKTSYISVIFGGERLSPTLPNAFVTH